MTKKKIDPNSFSSKIWLIVIDKLIVGAIIAIALIVYNVIKTNETRKYNESREEIQYNFKRAEYIKDLVPIVLDEKQQIMYRAYTLRSLLSTGAIDKNTAVSFGQILLTSDLLSFSERTISTINKETNKILTFKPSSNTTESFFMDIMMGTMPEGLPALIDECEKLKERAQWFPTRVDEMSDEIFNKDRIIRDSQAFWKKLFFKTIDVYNDLELQQLNKYSLGRLLIFYELLDDSDIPELKKWIGRDLKFPNILAYTKLIGYDNKYYTQAINYFLKIFKSYEANDRYFDFAGSFIFYLNTKDIKSKEIGKYLKDKILEIKNELKIKKSSLNKNDEDLFIKAAENYIIELEDIK